MDKCFTETFYLVHFTYYHSDHSANKTVYKKKSSLNGRVNHFVSYKKNNFVVQVNMKHFICKSLNACKKKPNCSLCHITTLL